MGLVAGVTVLMYVHLQYHFCACSSSSVFLRPQTRSASRVVAIAAGATIIIRGGLRISFDTLRYPPSFLTISSRLRRLPQRPRTTALRAVRHPQGRLTPKNPEPTPPTVPARTDCTSPN